MIHLLQQKRNVLSGRIQTSKDAPLLELVNGPIPLLRKLQRWMVSPGFHLLFQKVMNDRKQRYLPFSLEIFQDGRYSKDLFLSWFEQMECSCRGMKWLMASSSQLVQKTSQALRNTSEQLQCQEQQVGIGAGDPIHEISAFSWLNLICFVLLELSEHEISGGAFLVEVCLSVP